MLKDSSGIITDVSAADEVYKKFCPAKERSPLLFFGIYRLSNVIAKTTSKYYFTK